MKLILTLFFLFVCGTLGAQEQPLVITHLAGDFYIYTTYKDFDGTPFPSNSMYVVTSDGVVMIDTPWDTTQTFPLLDSIERRHGKRVVLCLATHYHDDRTAGFDQLESRGVRTYSTRQTRELCRKEGNPEADYTFGRDTIFTVGGISFRAYYPGEGHTPDNIVVWFPSAHVLYGGCLIKSTEVEGLGNVADANLKEWPRTIRRVMKTFPAPRFIIPGHFGWKSRDALRHTLLLLR